MVILRGDVHWAELDGPFGSEPGGRRPVLVVSADSHNRSALATVVVAVLTANTRWASASGNVFVAAGTAGLARDSVVLVTHLLADDRRRLDPQPCGTLPWRLQGQVSAGLKLSLDL